MHISRIVNILPLSIAENVEYFRVGSKNDGGYLNVKDFSKNDFAISFGVEGNVDWEKDFMNYGSGINCYDNSIDILPEKIDNSNFFKKTVGEEVYLKDCIEACPEDKDLILKMDIEGGEWNVLLNTNSQELSRFRQILVEYHSMLDIFSNTERYILVKDCLNKLNKTHSAVWIHANNYGSYDIINEKIVPDVIEVLYLRKSSYNTYYYNKVHKDKYKSIKLLDHPNNKDKEDIGQTFFL